MYFRQNSETSCSIGMNMHFFPGYPVGTKKNWQRPGRSEKPPFGWRLFHIECESQRNNSCYCLAKVNEVRTKWRIRRAWRPTAGQTLFLRLVSDTWERYPWEPFWPNQSSLFLLMLLKGPKELREIHCHRFCHNSFIIYRHLTEVPSSVNIHDLLSTLPQSTNNTKPHHTIIFHLTFSTPLSSISNRSIITLLNSSHYCVWSHLVASYKSPSRSTTTLVCFQSAFLNHWVTEFSSPLNSPISQLDSLSVDS